MQKQFSACINTTHGAKNFEVDMKILRHFLMILATLASLSYQAPGQPYYYYRDTTRFSEIWRISLQNGVKELFYSYSGIDSLYFAGNIYWDPTQKWAFIEGNPGEQNEARFMLDVVRADNTTLMHRFPDEPIDSSGTIIPSFVGGLILRNNYKVYDGIVYNPIKNLFYVTWTTDFCADIITGKDTTGEARWNDFLNSQKTAEYNASTFTLLDSLPVAPGWIAGISSVSDDGNYLYVEKWDYGKPKMLGKYSLITKQLIQQRDVYAVYVPASHIDIEDSKKGRYLLEFIYPGTDRSNKKYAIYDIDSDSTYPIIPFVPISSGRISSDGKYVIIEETPRIPSDLQTPTSGRFYHPGSISIFDGKTGALMQKLTLPPEGKVLLFDNYPNMLYYYLPAEQRSINIDLSKLATPQGMSVRLINSVGIALTGGSLQYYEGAWKDAVNNNDGTFTVTTSLTTVSLRMTYAYGSQTKSNVPVNGGPVTFQTVNTQVRLQNSQGALMDQGTVQYYAGAWRDFGTTSSGVATKELLPANYSFRITYAYASNDKQQNIGSNPTVVFQTVNAAVQLKNSQGTLIDQGTVQYYAGAWRDFGSTTNGVVTKELLPNNYSFRMNYAFASKDMQQNIGSNPTVVFSTVNAAVQLKNSLGNLIDQGTVQYYAGAWRTFGTTSGGTATMELLPNSYSFRMTYEYVSNDKTQDIGANSTVSYSTVLCTVRVSNTQGQAVDGAQISYYSGAWRAVGSTVGGQVTKELLPANLSFRMTYGGKSQDKQQNLLTNPVVEFVSQ